MGLFGVFGFSRTFMNSVTCASDLVNFSAIPGPSWAHTKAFSAPWVNLESFAENTDIRLASKHVVIDNSTGVMTCLAHLNILLIFTFNI